MQTVLLSSGESLVRAFDLPRGIIALVGGGGKTTLMLCLARELADAGARVIVTTTTHIFTPDGMRTLDPQSEAEARTALSRKRLVCFGKADENGKLSVPSLPVEGFAALADYVLVEADGAKRMPLKAPADHEPVIPPKTRLLIAVAGLEGVGRPLEHVAFRPERYAALCGKPLPAALEARDIALVLAHAQGQRKGLPEGARFSVLLNKADDEARERAALEIAAQLRRYDVERTVIAALGKR